MAAEGEFIDGGTFAAQVEDSDLQNGVSSKPLFARR
jgi:hypothetical protein